MNPRLGGIRRRQILSVFVMGKMPMPRVRRAADGSSGTVGGV